MCEWISPDGHIKKVIVQKGDGAHPTENANCIFRFLSGLELDTKTTTIGDCNDPFNRHLHILLTMMKSGETADATIDSKTFRIHLIEITPSPPIYEWSPQFKYDLAMNHKVKGNELYVLDRISDASHRYTRALKILHSIPLNVTKRTDYGSLTMETIANLKAILYGNLASCYLRTKRYEEVRDLCHKSLTLQPAHTKTLYKLAVAHTELQDYETAISILERVCADEPGNVVLTAALRTAKTRLAEHLAQARIALSKFFA